MENLNYQFNGDECKPYKIAYVEKVVTDNPNQGKDCIVDESGNIAYLLCNEVLEDIRYNYSDIGSSLNQILKKANLDIDDYFLTRLDDLTLLLNDLTGFTYRYSYYIESIRYSEESFATRTEAIVKLNKYPKHAKIVRRGKD